VDETFIWRDAANEWSWFPEDRPEDAIAHPSSDGPRFGVIHAGTAAGFWMTLCACGVRTLTSNPRRH